MSKDFNIAVKERRTRYAISKKTTISDAKIEKLIKEAVKYTPSSFNAQSSRVVVLFGEGHNKLWDIVNENLKKIVPEDQAESTEAKINSFRNGYGTVLFFEDNSVIKSLQKQFELYKDNFPVWSQQSSGMLQYVVWTSLEIQGLGASLQHYNPLIDNDVKNHWRIPQNWSLIAQMPFGVPTSPPDEKQFQPVEERVKIFR